MSDSTGRESGIVTLEDLPQSQGTRVRLHRRRGAGLDRYRGASGQVVGDDGIVVEVAVPGAGRISFWRREVYPIAETSSEALLASSGAGGVPGPRLRDERLRAGITRMVLASVLGVSAPRVSGIERQSFVSRCLAARYCAAVRAVAAVGQPTR